MKVKWNKKKIIQVLLLLCLAGGIILLFPAVRRLIIKITANILNREILLDGRTFFRLLSFSRFIIVVSSIALVIITSFEKLSALVVSVVTALKKVKRTVINNKTKKYLTLYFCIGTMILFVFCLFLFLSNGNVKLYSPSAESLNNPRENTMLHIDSIEIGRLHIRIKGWTSITGQNIRSFNTHILLRNIENGQYFKTPTSMIRRPDVTSYFHNPEQETNFNYDLSGWHAVIRRSELSLPLRYYEIVILYQNDDNYILIETGRKLEENR